MNVTDRAYDRLDAWGAYGRLEQIYREQLTWVPERSRFAAVACHQLGNVAYLKGSYDEALDWYRKSLSVEEELGNRAGMASSYHQRDIVPVARRMELQVVQLVPPRPAATAVVVPVQAAQPARDFGRGMERWAAGQGRAAASAGDGGARRRGLSPLSVTVCHSSLSQLSLLPWSQPGGTVGTVGVGERLRARRLNQGPVEQPLQVPLQRPAAEVRKEPLQVAQRQHPHLQRRLHVGDGPLPAHVVVELAEGGEDPLHQLARRGVVDRLRDRPERAPCRVALVREEETPYEALDRCGDPEAAARFVHQILNTWDREVMGAIYLDVRNRAIGYQIAYVGTLTRAAVEPRGILSATLLANAAAIRRRAPRPAPAR